MEGDVEHYVYPVHETVEAARGNIFAVDGSLLATSVPEYELHMDMLAGGIADEKGILGKSGFAGAEFIAGI